MERSNFSSTHLYFGRGSLIAIVTVGIDLAKSIFVVHGMDEDGKPALVCPNVLRAMLLVDVQRGWGMLDLLRGIQGWQPPPRPTNEWSSRRASFTRVGCKDAAIVTV